MQGSGRGLEVGLSGFDGRPIHQGFSTSAYREPVKQYVTPHSAGDCLSGLVGGQSSKLQIQRSGIDSRRYQNFGEVVVCNGVRSAS
jgi:hypothetical protein